MNDEGRMSEEHTYWSEILQRYVRCPTCGVAWENKTNKEIRAMISRADAWLNRGTKDTYYGHETYEMGVREALRWVLGELVLNPIQRLPHEREDT